MRRRIRHFLAAALTAWLAFGYVVPFTHSCGDRNAGAGLACLSHRDSGESPLNTAGVSLCSSECFEAQAIFGRHHCLACLLAKICKAPPGAARSPSAGILTYTTSTPGEAHHHLPDDVLLDTRLFRGPPVN